jgi:hypothetical protein
MNILLRAFIGYVSVPLVCAAAFAQAQRGLPPPKVELLSPEVTLRMARLGGRPVVQVTLNGKGPYPFLLDTGAHVSVVSQDLADELKLESTGNAQLNPPAGGPAMGGKLFQIKELQLSDVRITGLTCLSMDLSRMFSGSDAPRGVLSAASFPGQLLTFDYPHSQIRIRAGELPAPDGATVFEYEPAGRLPAIPVNVAGVSLRLDLDSGSPGGITLPGEYMDKLPLGARPVEVGKARIMNTEFTVFAASLKGSFVVGKYAQQDPRVEFLASFPNGNLGAQFLASFAVTLDSKNHRIMLIKSEGSSK